MQVKGIFKGAVCNFLTVLEHKNIIICLPIIRKHAKFTFVSPKKTMLQLFYFEMCVPCQNVCVCFDLCDLPTDNMIFDTGGYQLTEDTTLKPLKQANKLGQRSQIPPHLKSMCINLKSSMIRGIKKRR